MSWGESPLVVPERYTIFSVRLHKLPLLWGMECNALVVDRAWLKDHIKQAGEHKRAKFQAPIMAECLFTAAPGVKIRAINYKNRILCMWLSSCDPSALNDLLLMSIVLHVVVSVNPVPFEYALCTPSARQSCHPTKACA